jgi:heme exporter protein B
MLAILNHELKYYIKNFHELTYIYGFFILFMVVAPLGLRSDLHLLPEMAPSLLWLALLAGTSIGAMNMFQRDSESGIIELYQQLPVGLGGIILSKWLSFYIACVLPLIAAIPIYLALGRLPASHFPTYAIAIAAGGGALSILCCLAGVLTIGLERARAVLLLIILPLAVPVIIFGSYYLQHPYALWQPSLMFLLAFSVFLLPILCLAGASCIRASN